MLTTITSDTFHTQVEQSKIPIIIDVYATWCGFCEQMKPSFIDLSKEFQDRCTFVTLNVDEARDIAIMLGITAVPTFVLYEQGQMKAKKTGYMDKDELRLQIPTLLQIL